jgi:hypothetical protein
MTAGLAPRRDDFARRRQAALTGMETPKSSKNVTGEHTGTGDGRGWRRRMDVLAATMIVAAVLPTAYVSPNAPQFKHASQVCTKIAPW